MYLINGLATPEVLRAGLKHLTTTAAKYLDQAEDWLYDLQKNGDFDHIEKIAEATRKRLRSDIAHKFRTNEWGDEFMEKLHRMAMMFPSELTDNLEKIMKQFYDENH